MKPYRDPAGALFLRLGFFLLFTGCQWDLEIPTVTLQIRPQSPAGSRSLTMKPDIDFTISEIRSTWEKEGEVVSSTGPLTGWVLEGLTPGLWLATFEALTPQGTPLYDSQELRELHPGLQTLEVELSPVSGPGRFRLLIQSEGGQYPSRLFLTASEGTRTLHQSMTESETQGEGIEVTGELDSGFYLLELEWGNPSEPTLLAQRGVLWIFSGLTSIGSLRAAWDEVEAEGTVTFTYPDGSEAPPDVLPPPLPTYFQHLVPLFHVQAEQPAHCQWYWNGRLLGTDSAFSPPPSPPGHYNLELATWQGSNKKLDLQTFSIVLEAPPSKGYLTLWDQIRETAGEVRGLNGIRALVEMKDFWVTGGQDTAALGVFSRDSQGRIHPTGAITSSASGGASGALTGVTHLAVLGPSLLVSLGKTQGILGAWRPTQDSEDSPWVWDQTLSLTWPGILGIQEGPLEGSTKSLWLWTDQELWKGVITENGWGWTSMAVGDFASVESLAYHNQQLFIARFQQDDLWVWNCAEGELSLVLPGINGPVTPLLSENGRDLYVGGYYDHGVWHFQRSEADGTHPESWNLVNFYGGSELSGAGLKYTKALSLSDDESYLAAAGYGWDVIGLFSRNTTTGALTFLNHTQNAEVPFYGLDNPRVMLWDSEDLLVGSGLSDTLTAIRVTTP